MSDAITAPVGLVTLEAAKLHLRVDHSAEDALIASQVAAAYRAIETKLFRRIYPTPADVIVAQDETGIVVDATLNAAVLMLVGHLYANREAAAAVAVVEVPMGVEWLIEGYVNCAGGY